MEKPQLYRFYFEDHEGRELTVSYRFCKMPEQTRDKRLLMRKLHDKAFIKAVGWNAVSLRDREDRGLRFKLGKALIYEFVEDISCFPTEAEAVIIFRRQLLNQLNK